MAVAKTATRYRWTILGLTFVAQLSNALAAQAVAPLAPIFQPELGLTKAQVGVFSSAAFAGAWGVLLVAGTLTDRFGVRRMMSVGQMATGLCVLGMATVGSFLHAVAMMLAAGLGRGVTGPGVPKAILDWFPPAGRATAMGLNQTAIPLAGMVAATVLPSLALMAGWRSSIAALGFLMLAGGAVTALLYRDVVGSTATSSQGPGALAALREVARNRDLWVVSAIGTILSGAQFALITYFALYFKEVVLVPLIPEERARIVAAGGYLALAFVGSILAPVFWGAVSDRVFQGRRLVVVALVGALAALVFLAVAIAGAGLPAWLLPGLALALGATGMGSQGLYVAAVAETAGARHAGAGVGLSMTLSQLGFVAVPPLFGYILDASGSYPAAWLFLSALCLVADVMAVAMARRERRGIEG